jgi:putative DNA primase/helicase
MSNRDQVDSMLASLDPNMSRDDWVTVAMALKALYPGDDGWNLFNRWSSGGDTYSEGAARDTWKSVSQTGGRGFGTLVMMAKDAGWTPEYGSFGPDVTALLRNNKAKANNKAKVKSPTLAEWDQGKPATPDHPYLVRKGAGGAAELLRVRVRDGALLVPMMSRDGSIQSVQAISADGEKMFAAGMTAKGARLVLGKLTADTRQGLIAEGLATGWSVHEATGQPVVVAFSAGAIPDVAGDLVASYGGCRWVIAADAGKTGLSAAAKAADLHGCLVAAPATGDWNDQALGGAAIAAQIAEQVQRPTGIESRRVDLLASPVAPDYVVPAYLPRRQVTLLTGHGGSGKSTLALQLAVALVHGRTGFLGVQRRGRALFLSAEDDGQTVTWRLRIICDQMNVDRGCLEEAGLVSLDLSDDGVLFHEERDAALGVQVGRTTALYRQIDAYLGRQRFDLVVIDNASDCFAASENDRQLVRGFVQSLRRLAAKHDLAVLLLAHVNKQTAGRYAKATSESYSGSTAWHNSVRSRMTFTVSDDDPDAATLVHGKNQFGPLADPVQLTRHEGVWVHVGTPTRAQADVTALLAKEAERQHTADEEAVLKAVRERIDLGDDLNPAPHTSASAWKVLVANGALPGGFESRKADQQRFNAALTRLEKSGRLVREQYRHNYKSSTRWRVVDGASADIRRYPPVSAGE